MWGGGHRPSRTRKKNHPGHPRPKRNRRAAAKATHLPERLQVGRGQKPPGRPQETRRGGGAGRAGGGHGGWGSVWVYLDASALPNVLPTAAAIAAAAATLATAAAAAAAVAAAATAMSAKHRKAQVTKPPTARPCLALESPDLLMHRLAYCIPGRDDVSINRSRCPVSFESDPCISGNCPRDVCGGKPRRHSYS